MTDNEFYGQEIRRDNLRLMTENDTLRAELAEAKTQLAAALAGTAKECEGCKAATEKIAKARAEIDALHSGLGDMYDAAIDNAVSTFDEVFALAPEHTPECPTDPVNRCWDCGCEVKANEEVCPTCLAPEHTDPTGYFEENGGATAPKWKGYQPAKASADAYKIQPMMHSQAEHTPECERCGGKTLLQDDLGHLVHCECARHAPEVPRLSMTRKEMDKFLEENHKRIEQWPNSMVQEGDAP